MATDKRGGLRKGILVICIVVLISLALASANEFIIEPIAEESQETSANADPANSTDQGLGEENNANNNINETEISIKEDEPKEGNLSDQYQETPSLVPDEETTNKTNDKDNSSSSTTPPPNHCITLITSPPFICTHCDCCSSWHCKNSV